MAFHKLTPSQLQGALDAYHANANNETHAARALGLCRSTFQARLREARALAEVSVINPLTPPSDATALLKKQLVAVEQALQSERQTRLTETAIRSEILSLTERVSTLAIPQWVIAPSPSASSPGVPTLMVSDLHHGEVVNPAQINGVNAFNMEISRNRLHKLAATAIHLLRIISPKLDYPGIVIPLGGDMISGNIHDELTATNEFNTMPTVLDLFGELVGLITVMANTFGRVFLPCVTGNHGRDTHKIWNKDRHATSFDWLLYNFLAKHFENDSRVTFFIPDGPDAYYKIYDYRYLLSHGDQFRGGDGVIGALGPIIRGDHRKRSRNSQIDMEYDTLLIGHWHQYMHLTRLITNGSNKGYDEYAYNNNFPFEEPQQALWLTHPTHGITFRMPVKVGEKTSATPHKTAWVSVPEKG